MSQKTEIDYQKLVQSMQKKFVQRGLMRPVKIQRFREDLDNLIEACQEVYGNSLDRQWSELFPGVPFSAERLEQTLDECLKEERQRQLSLFGESLKKREYFQTFFGLVFMKGQLPLIVGIVTSFFTIPYFLYLFFSPTDLSLQLGLWGIVANVVIIIGLGIRYHLVLRKWRKSDGNCQR